MIRKVVTPNTERAGRSGELPLNKHQLKSQRTRQMIMDAAEPMFAPHGMAGVSMRQIARTAGVDMSLVSYHFDSKAALYSAVVNRIMAAFAERRAKALDDLERTKPEPTLIDLFDVQCDAWLDIGFGDSTHRAQLVLNRFHNTEDRGRDYWPSDQFVMRFIAALQKALPDKSAEFLHWTYHGVMGSLIYFLSSRDRIDRISGSHCDINSRDTLRNVFRRHVSIAFGVPWEPS